MADVTHADRSNWADVAKGLGIVLVAYGHLTSSAFHAGVAIPVRFFELTDSVLYSFHMPLFFFLAGLFCEQSYAHRGARGFIAEKIRYLGYPYLVWSALQITVECIATQHSAEPVTLTDLILVPIRSREHFWFLYALLWCYLAFALSKRWPRMGRAVMLVVAVPLFARPISTELFALAEFSMQFIFFVMGVCMSPIVLRADMTRWRGVTAVALILGFIAAALYVFTSVIAPTRLTEDYYEHHGLLLALAILGVAATVEFSRAVASTQFGRVAMTIGRYSMPVFLAHMLVGAPVRMVLMKLGIVSFWLLVSVPLVTAIIVPMLMYKLSMSLRFPFLFTWKSARPQPVDGVLVSPRLGVRRLR